MKRVLCAILCLLLLSSVLFGCDSSMLPASVRPREPELVLVGEYPYELPSIINASWCEDVNHTLAQTLLPLIDALEQANSDGDVACTHYEFSQSDDVCHLDVFVSSTETDGFIRLADFAVYPDGTADIEPVVLPGYITDPDLLNGYLRLSRYGLDPSLTADITGNMVTADVCRVIVDYYEALTGNEVDFSRVRLDSDDTYFLKSMSLGLCYDEYSYNNTYFEVSLTQYNSMLSQLLTHIITDYLGRSSEHITPDVLTDALDLYLKLYFASPNDTVQQQLYTSGSDLSVLFNTEYVNRDDIAVTFNEVYKHCFGELSEPHEPFFTDFASEDAETAYWMGFIDNFPSYGLFSYDYCPREYQLFSMVDYYMSTCYWKNFSSLSLEPYVNGSGLISTLGWADRYLDSFAPPAHDAVTVDNSRNYQWYFSQFETGEYSDMNCMPSITAMGIKWYFADSAVSVADIRELWLPEYDSGWYMTQVTDSLDHYNVPYEWHDLSEDMTEQLDMGRIILAQMSEAAYDASGHCFVIYGYRKLGDSVQYMVHDPGIYNGLDEFGKPPGEAMLLDGAYVEWIIERMTYSYITIG